jgi:PBSX family phage terminase large subunit
MQRTVEFHQKQYETYNFTTQYCAAIAGVQSGKTFVGAYWAAKMIDQMPAGGVGMIVAPTFKILDQSTLVKFFGEFPQYRQFYKEQKRMIALGDKTVFIRSAEEPYSLEGITADWVWGDEAGKFNLIVWTILRSRTAIKKGKVLFTTTPYNMGWLYRDFFLPARDKKDPDLTVVSWASVDSPYFSEDFANKEKARLRPEEYNRRYLGEFTRMEGLVYNLHQWHIIKPITDMRADITLGGIDWGFTNPAALTVIKYYDGKFHIVDEWYQTGKTTREIIEAAQALQNRWGVNRWYADSANPEKIQEAGTNTGLYVIPYDKGKDALTAGIGYLQQLINENMFDIFDTCKNTLAEFESYHYPELESVAVVKMDKPIPEDNHLMDAIRYAIHGYQPTRKFIVNIPPIQYNLQRLLQGREEPQNKTSFE